MFRILGQFVTRFWPIVLLVWAGVFAVAVWYPPPWSSVVDDGELSFIPDDLPSRQGERIFQETFSKNLLGSAIVIVVRQENDRKGLRPRDKKFVAETLIPILQWVLRPSDLTEADRKSIRENLIPNSFVAEFEQLQKESVIAEGEKESLIPGPIVDSILSFEDEPVGELLVSEDGQATLIVIGLRTELFLVRNGKIVEFVKDLTSPHGRFQANLPKDKRMPVGLDIAVSGTATVGWDMMVAAQESASATHLTTVLFVLVLLLLIYRAPLLVLIPMSTVAMSVGVAMGLLSVLAEHETIRLFISIEVYVQVIMYGAGVDYCMFLMARYREEIDAGESYEEALQNAVKQVGAALVASAGTTVAGIGMMIFALNRKYQQAGVAISLSLVFVLIASLTLAPALLRLFGRWAFWPKMQTEGIGRRGGWLSPTSLMSRLLQGRAFRGIWEKIGERLQRSPGRIWLLSIAVLLPFAVVGIVNHNHLSFGLLSELPEENTSVVGAKAVQDHFPAGATGPVTILLTNRNMRFADFGQSRTKNTTGVDAIRALTNRLIDRKESLSIADIRSIGTPLGITAAADRAEKRWNDNLPRSVFERGAKTRKRHDAEIAYYVSTIGELKGHVARIDIVFEDDPFSREMMDRLDRMKQAVIDSLPPDLKEGTQLNLIGPTAGIRDIKTVAEVDQIRIDLLAMTAVFLVLLALIRRPAISGYLILSVVFSYLVTLGITFAFFWMLDPDGFGGLDWKVPIFLFTILIAVGEDYNIYLFTRIEEEQKLHGPIRGITVALSKTGAIISGCGVIMAGTFSSLMTGTLLGMQQLGFALAVGVLLDTFVVRPVLVPAYLILLNSGRFGLVGRLLGAPTSPATNLETQTTAEQSTSPLVD